MRKESDNDVIARDFFDSSFVTPEQISNFFDTARGQINSGNRGASLAIYAPERPLDPDSGELKIAEIVVSNDDNRRPPLMVTLCFAGVEVHMTPEEFIARI